MNRSPITLLAVLAFSSIVATACDKGDDDKSSDTTAPEAVVTEPSAVLETDPPVSDGTCAPLATEGVQDQLVADAEAFGNTLAASAAANFEPATGGLECALPASGISGTVDPGEAATPGAISAISAPVTTKADETILGFAALDTTGACALRAIVVQNDVPTPYVITSQATLCSAYEALDGFDAGEFAALG